MDMNHHASLESCVGLVTFGLLRDDWLFPFIGVGVQTRLSAVNIGRRISVADGLLSPTEYFSRCSRIGEMVHRYKRLYEPFSFRPRTSDSGCIVGYSIFGFVSRDILTFRIGQVTFSQQIEPEGL
jgi:hypothetical protein